MGLLVGHGCLARRKFSTGSSRTELVLTMPREVLPVGPEVVVRGEGNPLAVEITQRFLIAGRFVEGGMRDDHSIVVVQGPQPLIE